eukprot:14854288-Alexandrium_andersonii.AAC.1
MSASLVGSEMCIRDSNDTSMVRADQRVNEYLADQARAGVERAPAPAASCLLYTSDAADDM